MISSALVAMYLWQLRLPLENAPRPDTEVRYQQTVLPQGELTVTEESPEAATVPPGASRVPMLRLRMTASCAADVHVNGVHAWRRGLGFSRDIQSVYLVHRGTRVSQARQLSENTGQVSFSLRDLIVPACGTEDVVLYADFSPDASPAGEHRFELTAEGVTTDNAAVRVDHRRGTYVLQTAGAPVGGVTVNFLKLTERIRYGSRQTVARFTLRADERDQRVHAITFTNDGSARDEDLRSLYAEMRSKPVSLRTTAMDGSLVKITFDPPLQLTKNQTLSLKLKADVRVGYSRTIGFTVEAPSDVEAEPVTGR